MFIFYIAGHETSGHTLSFALNMLAVHQEEQEALYQHIKGVLPDGRLPTCDDIPRLDRDTATLNETLRMFPPAPEVPKYSAEDASLVVGNRAGETTAIPVPAGTRITIDVAGLHYNPRYWDDPYTFKPERFMGKWDKDAFVPFSGGARACIGRGFFEMTGLGMLTTLIQRYKVEPHPKFAGESFEQLKARYSEATGMITLTPLCTSLVFKKSVTTGGWNRQGWGRLGCAKYFCIVPPVILRARVQRPLMLPSHRCTCLQPFGYKRLETAPASLQMSIRPRQ